MEAGRLAYRGGGKMRKIIVNVEDELYLRFQQALNVLRGNDPLRGYGLQSAVLRGMIEAFIARTLPEKPPLPSEFSTLVDNDEVKIF